jgi:hypothetical protein
VEGANFCQGRNSALNIAAATVIKKPSDVGAVGGLSVPSRIARVQVLVAGSTADTVNDCATASATTVANQVGVIPNVIGSYLIDMPCYAGICVVPGTGMTVSASFD